MPHRRPVSLAAMAVALAFALAPGSVAARDITGSLTYPERIALPEDAVAMVELRDTSGRFVGGWRFPTEGAQVPLPFVLSDAPEGALTLTGAVFLGGVALRVTDSVPVAAGSADLDLGALRLYPHLPLGFASTLRCGARTVQLGFYDNGARLRVGRDVIELAPVPTASGARYEAPDDPGTWVWTQGDAATVSLAGTELPECAPAVAGLMLPVAVQGDGWAATLDRDRLRIDRDGQTLLDGPQPAVQPVRDAMGAIAGWQWQAEGLVLTLQDRPCARPGLLPQPFTAILEEGDATMEGCAGEPIDLLRDGEWTVIEVGGTAIDTDLGVSMTFADGRILGYGGCNRYSGGLVLDDTRMSVAGVAATRRACPGPRMGVEDAFFRALGAMAGFDIDADGRLLIRDAAGAVIIVAVR